MFNCYEFTYAGESSAMYGLMVYDIDGKRQSDVSFGNKASIVETRINRRIQPIYFGTNYHTNPLEFRLVFGADHALDRYEMDDVNYWLTGRPGYEWMTIGQPDMDQFQFRCMITELIPISHGWLPVAFQATVRCDCPYAYGYPFEYQYQIDGETDIIFYNEGTVREFLKPDITFSQSGSSLEMKIVNAADGDREFSLKNIPAGATVTVDNRNGVIVCEPDGNNLYSGFNMKFFRLARGENRLKVYGNGTLTISGRFLYNIAG